MDNERITIEAIIRAEQMATLLNADNLPRHAHVELLALSLVMVGTMLFRHRDTEHIPLTQVPVDGVDLAHELLNFLSKRIQERIAAATANN